MKNQVFALILMIVYQLVIVSHLSLQLKLEGSSTQSFNRKYLNYFSPQGHELDCTNICKECVQENLVKEVYEKMVDDNIIITKAELTASILAKINLLKTSNPDDFRKSVREALTKSDLNSDSTSIFRIYYELCLISFSAFYA